MIAAGSPRASLSRGWLVLAVVPVLLATLPPQPDWPLSHTQFLSSLLPGSAGGWFDVAQNVVLYAPLGFALAGRGHTAGAACAVAALLSLATELLQFAVPGRSPALRDVLVNTSGAWAGVLLWRTAAGRTIARLLVSAESSAARARRPDRRHASALCAAWGVVVAAVMTVTALLLTPAPPPHEFWVASPLIDAGRGALHIGSSGSAGGGYHGLVDEVRLFSRARTEQEIRADLERPAGAPLTGGAHLVAAYGFDVEPGSVVADDSGHGHEGVLLGARWVGQGRLGGALSFDGNGSELLVHAAPALDLREEMTLEAWVRPGDTQAPEAAIVARERSAYYLAQASADGPHHAAGGGRFGGVPRYARLTDPVVPGEWTHLAITYDGQVLRLYKNGSLAAMTVHWAPHRPEDMVVNDVPLPPARVKRSDRLRKALRGEIDATLRLRCGANSRAAAPVFVVEGIQDTEVLTATASATELQIGTWTWASRLHLASPPTRIPDALTGCAPGTAVTFDFDGRIHQLAAARDGQRIVAVTPGLGAGWALVFHAQLLPLEVQLALTFGWLALLAAPVAYWARRSAGSMAGITIAALACGVVPELLHVRGLNSSEFAALLSGSALAAACRHARFFRW